MVLRAVLYIAIAAAATIAGHQQDVSSCSAVAVKHYTGLLPFLSGILSLLPTIPAAIETTVDYCPGDRLACGIIGN